MAVESNRGCDRCCISRDRDMVLPQQGLVGFPQRLCLDVPLYGDPDGPRIHSGGPGSFRNRRWRIPITCMGWRCASLDGDHSRLHKTGKAGTGVVATKQLQGTLKSRLVAG